MLIAHGTHGHPRNLLGWGQLSIPKGRNLRMMVGKGEGNPLSTSYEVWGSTVSSPSGVQGASPTANAFWTHQEPRKCARGCKCRLFAVAEFDSAEPIGCHWWKLIYSRNKPTLLASS